MEPLIANMEIIGACPMVKKTANQYAIIPNGIIIINSSNNTLNGFYHGFIKADAFSF
jgi:hypothetical protein